jgi:hypothetical protein
MMRHSLDGSYFLQRLADPLQRLSGITYYMDALDKIKRGIIDIEQALNNVSRAGYSDCDNPFEYGNTYHVGFSDSVKKTIRKALNHKLAEVKKLYKLRKLQAAQKHQAFINMVMIFPDVNELRQEFGSDRLRIHIRGYLRQRKALVNFEK